MGRKLVTQFLSSIILLTIYLYFQLQLELQKILYLIYGLASWADRWFFFQLGLGCTLCYRGFGGGSSLDLLVNRLLGRLRIFLEFSDSENFLNFSRSLCMSSLLLLLCANPSHHLGLEIFTCCHLEPMKSSATSSLPLSCTILQR